jgi:hypothetical protein
LEISENDPRRITHDGAEKETTGREQKYLIGLGARDDAKRIGDDGAEHACGNQGRGHAVPIKGGQLESFRFRFPWGVVGQVLRGVLPDP